MLLNELFLIESPETLYVKRKLLNTDEFVTWAKSQGFKNILDPDEFHVTIAFSKKPFEYKNLSFQSDNKLLVRNKKDREVTHLGDKGAVVLKFSCDILQTRWKEFRDAGANWDFENYKPHVSITYVDPNMDLTKIIPYTGELLFGPEIHDLVDENWTSKVKSVKLA